jgi:hypothetical protein
MALSHAHRPLQRNSWIFSFHPTCPIFRIVNEACSKGSDDNPTVALA